MEYTEKFFKDLEADLQISQYELIEEWLRQPSLYIKYAMASAHFSKVSAESAEAVKVIEADLEADAAEDPEACLGKGVKATADRVKGYAKTHPDRARAVQKAIDAKYRADMALSAVFSMQQRKDALEHLVRLQGMELHSEPKAYGTNRGDVEKQALQRAASDAVKKRGLVKRRS